MTFKALSVRPGLILVVFLLPVQTLAAASLSQSGTPSLRFRATGVAPSPVATVYGNVNEFFLSLWGQSASFATMQDTILEDIFSNLRAFSGTTLDIQGLRLFLNLSASGIDLPGLGSFTPNLLGISIGGLHLGIEARENDTRVRFGISGLGLFLSGSFGNITATTSGALMNLRIPNNLPADYQLFALGPVGLARQLVPTPTPVPVVFPPVVVATLTSVVAVALIVKRRDDYP